MSSLEEDAAPIRDPGLLRALIVMGLVEGTSTLALFFVAMPLKYLAGMPKAVTVVGAIHGILFIAYVAMLLWARRQVPISTRLTMWGLVGAVLPFGPFIFDVPLVRLLRQARSAPSAAA